MASILDLHLAEIPDLCRRYGVARLELFGSAAGDAFDPQRSDLDFLVEFDADQNPYFIEAVNKTRRVVYAAEDPQAA